MKPQKLEININIVVSPLGEDVENSIYDVVTRNQVILDVQEEVKRCIEENVPEWGRCTPVIAHKTHKAQL